MPPDLQAKAEQHDLAFYKLAFSLLEETLSNAGDLTVLRRQLAEQLRELTGARLVVLTRCREAEGDVVHEVTAVEPQRRHSPVDSPAMMALAAMSHDLAGSTLWQADQIPAEIEALLPESLSGSQMIVPLRVGRKQVGALLLFGLPDLHSIGQVLDLLDALARTLALVLQNAFLFEDQDITIAARTRELAESEAKFRTLVTNSEGIVYLIAKDGTFLLSEGRGLSLLGFKPGEVVGRSAFELYAGYPEMLDQMRRVFQGETVASEVKINDIHFRSWYAPYFDAAGEIVGLMGLSVDISDLKQAEEALEEHQANLEVKVRKRTEELRTIVNAMAGRENRMVELKLEIKELRAQLEAAGLKPQAGNEG